MFHSSVYLYRIFSIIFFISVSYLLYSQTNQSNIRDYSQSIVQGDKSLNEGDYLKAIQYYEKAWDSNPRLRYPERKIEQIMILLSEAEQKKIWYEKAIQYGDDGYEKKNYSLANSFYYMALRLDPEAEYPRHQITEIATLFVDPENDLRFRIILIHATKSIDKKKYQRALGFYKQALVMKPDEVWIEQKMKEILVLSEKNLKSLDVYSRYLLDADNYLEKQNWKEARANYEKASQLKQGEIYPKSRIIFIDHLTAFNINQQSTFQSLMEDAHVFRNAGDYENAAIHCQKALNLKNGDPEARNLLNKMNRLSKDEDKLPEYYEKTINNADFLSLSGDWEAALIGFQRCKDRHPDDQYVNSRIAELSWMLSSRQEKQKSYAAAIKNGDQSLADSNYTKALSEYRYATKILPLEKYPIQQIALVNQLIANPLQNHNTPEVMANDFAGAAKKPEEMLKENAGIQEITSFVQQENQLPDATSKSNPSYATSSSAGTNTKINTSPISDKKEELNTKVSAKESNSISQKKAVPANPDQLKYEEAIAFADQAFSNKDLTKATNAYKAALRYKPNEVYPKERLILINEQLKSTEAITAQKNADYKCILTVADLAFKTEDYPKAIEAYTKASDLSPAEIYPKQRINEANKIIGQQTARKQKFESAVQSSEMAIMDNNYNEALIHLKTALKVNPESSVVKEKIDELQKRIIENKQQQAEYSGLIIQAEKSAATRNYTDALLKFESARALKPTEALPINRIQEITIIIAQDKQKKEEQFISYQKTAEDFSNKNNLQAALEYYKLALSLKPEEIDIKRKYEELKIEADKKMKAINDAFNLSIEQADIAFQNAEYEKAMEYYTDALKLSPEATHPGKMIARIRKFMFDNSIVDISVTPFILSADSEKRFQFKPILPNMRKQNYLLVRVRSNDKSLPKLFLSYGSEGKKNGGIVLKEIQSGIIKDYIIHISMQDQWSREDNNWLSLYAENGDIEVNSVKIAKGN